MLQIHALELRGRAVDALATEAPDEIESSVAWSWVGQLRAAAPLPIQLDLLDLDTLREQGARFLGEGRPPGLRLVPRLVQADDRAGRCVGHDVAGDPMAHRQERTWPVSSGCLCPHAANRPLQPVARELHERAERLTSGDRGCA